MCTRKAAKSGRGRQSVEIIGAARCRSRTTPTMSDGQSMVWAAALSAPRLPEDFAGEVELRALVEGAAALVFVEVVHLDALRPGVGVVGRKHS